MAKTEITPPSRRTMYRGMLQDEFPVYPDKILRDKLGPPPSRGKPSSPVLRDKKGNVIRALVSNTKEKSSAKPKKKK